MTWRSAAVFFYYGDHRRGTEPQHASGVAYATPVECHGDHLSTDLEYPASILVLQEKDPPCASVV
jgi:hypothetical protein